MKPEIENKISYRRTLALVRKMSEQDKKKLLAELKKEDAKATAELEKQLAKDYKLMRNEALQLAKEFEHADLENWDEY